MSDKTKNIVIGIIVIIILFGAYKFLVNKKEPEQNLVSSSTAVVPKNFDTRTQSSDLSPKESAVTLQRVKRVRIDSDIFSSDMFESFYDFRTEILPEPVGKADPFSSDN